MKLFFAVFLALATLFWVSGFRSSTNTPALDDHAYTLTLNKRITVVSNQIITQISNAQSISDATKDNCIASAQASIRIVDEAIQEVETMPAPAEYEADKQNALRIMRLTKEHMEQFVSRMGADNKNADYGDIVDLLQNDYNTLTAEFVPNYK